MSAKEVWALCLVSTIACLLGLIIGSRIESAGATDEMDRICQKYQPCPEGEIAEYVWKDHQCTCTE